MKNAKQLREMAILGIAVVLLVVIGAVTLKGGSSAPQPAPPSKPRTAQAAATTTAAAAPANSTVWVDNDRLALLLTEMKGGRNPFQDLMTPAAPKDKLPVATNNGTPAPVPNPGGALPALPNASLEIDKTVKLQWISWQQLAAKLKSDFPDVQIRAGKKAETAKLSGPEVDVMDAVGTLPEIDCEPPRPPFQLVGIITNNSVSFAVIALGGKTYSLYQGEVVPEVGWTVTGITPTGVTLKKGKQSVSLRLAGGKA